jgi:hypothetical protein
MVAIVTAAKPMLATETHRSFGTRRQVVPAIVWMNRDGNAQMKANGSLANHVTNAKIAGKKRTATSADRIENCRLSIFMLSS